MILSAEESERLVGRERDPNRPFTVLWEYEECTDRTSAAFARLARKAESSGSRRIILDMQKCRFLSVGGIRHILEWHQAMLAQGRTVRLTGLSSLLVNVLELAKLEWILA
jgi:anti-anti-sigma regulatory factor